MNFGKPTKDEVSKLSKALIRLEKQMEKLPEKSLKRARLMKSYESKERKLRKLIGEPVKSELQDKIEDKNLEDIPESAW